MARAFLHRSAAVLCAALAAGSFGGAPAHPARQDTATYRIEDRPDSLRGYELDEVIVTGTRTFRKMIDIPYSVERIDNSQFKFEKKTAINEVLGEVPGLFMQSRYGNHDVRISIRGFGSRSNSGIRGVRILMDGIPESEPDGQTRIEAIDFQSIGRIEIVKGNSSSLYTNAPGGVINFINDIEFPRTFAVQFNEFGAFGLHRNGFKVGVRTDNYGFLNTYSYHNYRGYRPHSDDYWHIYNTVLETTPGDFSNLKMYGYFVDGIIRLPGSLPDTAFWRDPYQANPRDVGRDSKRLTTKGRLGLEFTTLFGEEKNQEIQVTAYGTMKYFDRTAATYRIITRNGVGGSGRYVLKAAFSDMPEEFSIGGDLFLQNGPIEEYDNIGGTKGDQLVALTNEAISNTGFYFQNTLGLLPEKLDFLVTGRYDKVVFDARDQLFGARSSVRKFSAFTPKAALNYKISPTIAVYTSYGLSFDSPAANELDNYPTSSNPQVLLNPDLQAQKSDNFELGTKGTILFPDVDFVRFLKFEGTFFWSVINDEIVPFEDQGAVFYRNAAQTDRKGLELGVTGELFTGLTLKTAYTFSDFSYDEYVARTVDIDTSGNTVIADRSYAGNVVPSVPRHNLTVSFSADREIAEHLTGHAKVGFQYVTGMYVNDQNSDRTSDYRLWSVSAGLDYVLGRFDILLNAGMNNVADLTYVAFININSERREFYEAGEPQNWYAGLNIGYTF
jgi:iron complex outermembrane receptor protein